MFNKIPNPNDKNKDLGSVKQVCLFTATGEENLGDELITSCEILQLQEKFPHIQITLFSHNPANTRRFLLSQNIELAHIDIREYFPNHARKYPLRNIVLFLQTIKTIARSDQIIIGGGGLLYGKNEEGTSPLRLWWLRAGIARIFRKPVTFLSLGISASESELGGYVGGIFQGNTITVRDKKSQDILENFGYTSKLLPDPVFLYVGINSSPKKKIGVALRKGFIETEIIKSCIKQCCSLGYEVILLPHSLHPTDEKSHDGYYLQEILLPGVQITQTIEQTLQAYSTCSIILAMRLHSMILAITHHIPFIALSYGQKTDALCDALQWKYRIHTQNLGEEILQTMLENIETHREQCIEELKKYQQEQRLLYLEIFPKLCE